MALELNVDRENENGIRNGVERDPEYTRNRKKEKKTVVKRKVHASS